MTMIIRNWHWLILRGIMGQLHKIHNMIKESLTLAGVWYFDMLCQHTQFTWYRLQCLCIKKMFCLHGSVVLHRYRNEMNGAMMAEMEDGVASTEQSTQR